jgi:hypothetical protein
LLLCLELYWKVSKAFGDAQFPVMLSILRIMLFTGLALAASYATETQKLEVRQVVAPPNTVGWHSKTVIGSSTSCMYSSPTSPVVTYVIVTKLLT